MVNQLFTIREAFDEGWRLTKEHFGFLIGYQVILYFLIILFAVIGNDSLSALHIFGIVIVNLAQMGLYHAALVITAGMKPQYAELYQNWRLFISWLVASFIFGFVFTLGIILLIVPGCYILARYGLFPFFILDKDLGPIDGLKQAGKATKGIRGHLFLLFIACFALNILGFILLVIGLFVTIPITLLALTFAYRKIISRQDQQLLTL